MSYDPTIARWTTEDPDGYAGSGANLYQFGEDNPIKFVDPSGLAAIWGLPKPPAGPAPYIPPDEGPPVPISTFIRIDQIAEIDLSLLSYPIAAAFSGADDVVLEPVRWFGVDIPYLSPVVYNSYVNFDGHAIYLLRYGFQEPPPPGHPHSPQSKKCPE
jgi:hypothetical protein